MNPLLSAARRFAEDGGVSSLSTKTNDDTNTNTKTKTKTRTNPITSTEALGHSVIPKGLVERCSFQSPQKFINDLLHGMYTREYMAGHSVTGQSSSSCTEGKPGLAKQDLVEITNAAKLKFTCVTDTNIKAFIRQKLNNAAKFQKQ
ncbi:unnamed protein product [Gadus morhua 'NCC']